MAFDQAHVLFTAHGTLGTPPIETWSFGIRCAATLVHDTAALSNVCAQMANPTAALFAAAGTDPQALTHVKAAWIETNGNYPPGASAGEFTFSPPIPIGGTAAPIPFQTALAVSTGTALARGKGSKGRFYLPMPRFSRGLSGQIPASDALNVANAAKAWILAFRGLAEPLVPSVFSQGTAQSPGASHNMITSVRVGRVMDTIRSRRRNLVEDYQLVSIP